MKIALGGLAVMGLLTAVLGWQLLSAQEALGESRQALDQAVLANNVNQETITQVTMTLDSCIAGRAVDEQQNQVTIAALQVEAAELATRATEVRVVREEVFRDPTCNEVGSLDIDLLCPAWSDELRERATTLNRD